jgi:hypothetical protein
MSQELRTDGLGLEKNERVERKPRLLPFVGMKGRKPKRRCNPALSRGEPRFDTRRDLEAKASQ